MSKLGQINKTSNSSIRSVISEQRDNFYYFKNNLQIANIISHYFKSNLQIVNAISQESLHSVDIICRNTLLASFASSWQRKFSMQHYSVFINFFLAFSD